MPTGEHKEKRTKAVKLEPKGYPYRWGEGPSLCPYTSIRMPEPRPVRSPFEARPAGAVLTRKGERRRCWEVGVVVVVASNIIGVVVTVATTHALLQLLLAARRAILAESLGLQTQNGLDDASACKTHGLRLLPLRLLLLLQLLLLMLMLPALLMQLLCCCCCCR